MKAENRQREDEEVSSSAEDLGVRVGLLAGSRAVVLRLLLRVDVTTDEEATETAEDRLRGTKMEEVEEIKRDEAR
ncbi:hypothetical protein RUM43_003894 [Polyplax serrata]|uniref:Uncharacterized protein n=1 Tax=Polyplax serrata TaxID=468196 RepID=A0AAN8S910_POLSC